MERSVEAESTRMAQLVGRASGGDRDAYGELVELSWPQLVGLARTILAGDDEAEDLVQEALVHAWTRLGSLRRPEKFPAWIRRIVSRRCFAHLRRSRSSTDPVDNQRSEPRCAGIDVQRALARLAPRQRAVIHLTLVEGYSASEAASMMGIRPATARVHRHRALAQMRDDLEAWRR
jgi:RNA polymerase sigma-70 factor (ECF subfamily)